jgi:putative ABC transport system permease protein
MNGWLENFAYRTVVGLWIFPAVGILTLAAAFLTVGYHAVRAARLDPVRALRYE